jgi:2-polyprenyl-3-methyl-5-hydroxy-6-metoxy-1,4-benzoquinol methylase
MTFPSNLLKLNTQKDILIIYETDAPSSQQVGIIPLMSPSDERFGIAVNLTWIRELHYLTYYGQSLLKWGDKFQIHTQQDVEQLQIWPIVAIDYPNEDIFQTLYSRCQDQSESYRKAQKVSLRDLQQGLQFENGVTTTFLQLPELIALIDSVRFRFPEAYFIGSMTTIVSGNEIRRDPDWYRSFDGLPVIWKGVKCEVCGSSDSQVLHIIGPSRIVQCRECGLQYDNPQAIVQIEALNKYAADIRDQRSSARSILRAEQNAHTLLNGINAINANLRGQSLLEIGCASGELLDILGKRYFWTTDNLWGMDLSKRAIETARSSLGLINVFDQDLKQLHFPDQKFSAVVLFNTIEHLPDLRVVLAEVYRILQNDGCVLIGSVPNAGSLAAKLFPEGFIAKNFPDGQHHYQFTPETLSRLCKDTGFEVIRLDGEMREPVLDKTKETAIWLAYSCGIPLGRLQNDKNMLRELNELVNQFHRNIAPRPDRKYDFSIEEKDFLTTETLIEFWRREIWSSPYLSDEFDIWLRKNPA